MNFPKLHKNKQRTERRKLERAYTAARHDYLKEHPWCQVCEEAPATEVHHKRGRGKHLLDESTWLPVCPECHRAIHASPAWAYEAGYMESRHER